MNTAPDNDPALLRAAADLPKDRVSRRALAWPPQPKEWFIIFGACTALTLFFALELYWERQNFGMPMRLSKQLWWQAMEWYTWGALLPAIVGVCRQLRTCQSTWKSVGLHLLTGLGFALIHGWVLATGALVEALVLRSGWSWARLWELILVNHWRADVLTYVALISVWYAFDFSQESRERERQASELSVRLSAAKLQALKMQLHPHFLFNTLNGIASLNYDDPKAANKMLARLSDLLRLTLENDGPQEVPLRQELEFIRRYLELEQMRLGDRLTVHWEIEPETLAAPVPNLLLQPLVENALLHGIAPFSAPGQIWISARREGPQLHLQIKDTGPGLSSSQVKAEGRSGVGLANTRDRLLQLYGAAQALRLEEVAEGGFVASVYLPFSALSS